MSQTTIILVPIDYKGSQQLAVYFNYNIQFINLIKSIGGKWSRSNKCWLIPNTQDKIKEVFCLFKGHAWIDKSAVDSQSRLPKTVNQSKPKKESLPPLTTVQSQTVKRFKNYLSAYRYSDNTIKTYTDALSGFLRFHASEQIEDLSTEHITRFNNEYILKNEYSNSYQNRMMWIAREAY